MEDSTMPKKTPTGEANDQRRRGLFEMLAQLADATTFDTMSSCLEKLRSRIVDDFRAEEAEEGMFGEILLRAPHHSKQVQKLVDEHREMLATLDDLVASTRARVDGSFDEIRRDVTRFEAQVRRHESDEIELFNDATLTDLGGQG